MKTYKIIIKGGNFAPTFLQVLLREFQHWGIAESQYQIDGTVITTTDKKVVDVITETFINSPHLIEVVIQ